MIDNGKNIKLQLVIKFTLQSKGRKLFTLKQIKKHANDFSTLLVNIKN
jgi:hypothetical protein